MGLQGGIYDGWGQKSFLSDLCAPAAQRSSPAGVSKRCHSRGAGRRLTSAPTTREPLPSPTTPPLIRALSAERPHQNEHHRKPGEKPKMHPPFEFGLARPSPITVIDQERSKHTCERDEDQPGPAHSGRLSWEVADSWRERRSRSSALYDACEWHHQHCGFGAALSSRGTDDTE